MRRTARPPSDVLASRALGLLSERLELPLQALKLLVREVLHVDELVARLGDRADQLVELELNHARVAVLSALNEKEHQERDDRRARVDHELPRVGELKQRACDRPGGNRSEREQEGPRRADGQRDAVSKSLKSRLR